ncbi:hypothetical protein RFI_29683, partial [Reticulomyxa filosa]
HSVFFNSDDGNDDGEINNGVDIDINIDEEGTANPLNKKKETMYWITRRFDPCFIHGKKCRYAHGDERIYQFLRWLFHDPICVNERIVVICGHSIWFRRFFKSYLPRDFKHPITTLKMQNSSVFQCQLIHFVDNNDPLQKDRYCIDPDSILTIRGGFRSPSKIL